MDEALKGKLLVIRVGGEPGLSPDQRRTLQHLNLKRKNWAVVVDDTPSYVGMLKAVESEVVWGPLSQEGLDLLVGWLKLGQEDASKVKAGDFSSLRGPIRLHPPRKGYKEAKEHKGYLGEEVNALLKRMA